MALAGGVNLILRPRTPSRSRKARMLAAGRPLQDLRRAGRRLRRGRGLRRRGAEAPLRRPGRRRSHPRARPRHRGQPGRAEQRAHRAERPGAGGGDPRGAGERRASRPRDVGYVEAHGTGTSLGDPIEVQALGAVLGEGRAADDRRSLIGSVKTNIGHLEAAAGVAGLIKVVLALQHREIPPHLHFQEPNPHIPWAELPVAVPTQRHALAAAARDADRPGSARSASAARTRTWSSRRRPPVPAPAAAESSAPQHLLRPAGDERDRRCASWPRRYRRASGAHGGTALADVCFTANDGSRAPRASRRRWSRHDSASCARASSTAVAAGDARTRVLTGAELAEPAPRGRVPVHGPGIAVRGDGAGAVRDAADVPEGAGPSAPSCCEGLWSGRCWSVLYPGEGEASPLDETAYTQPALFALEYALSGAVAKLGDRAVGGAGPQRGGVRGGVRGGGVQRSRTGCG